MNDLTFMYLSFKAIPNCAAEYDGDDYDCSDDGGYHHHHHHH